MQVQVKRSESTSGMIRKTKWFNADITIEFDQEELNGIKALGISDKVYFEQYSERLDANGSDPIWRRTVKSLVKDPKLRVCTTDLVACNDQVEQAKDALRNLKAVIEEGEGIDSEGEESFEI